MRQTNRVVVFAVVFMAWLTIGCAGSGPAIDGEVDLLPGRPQAPLARIADFSTDVPVTVTLSVSDGEREWTVPTPDTPQTVHSVPIVGMRAGTQHTLRIDLRGTDGSERRAAAVVEFETAPLPAGDFPPLEVTVNEAERMEPGLTLFSAIRWLPGAEDLASGWIVVVDEAGAVVWYYRAPHRVVDVRHTPRGTFLYLYNDGLVEIDGLGNTLAHWRASGLGRELPDDALTVEADILHHQAEEQPSGEILTLGTELRAFANYPTDVANPDAPRETANVIGDVVLLMNRNGTLAADWKLLDILDPYRMAYGSLGRFWDREGYTDIEGGTRDWTHANGAIIDPRDGNIIVTLRHQDAAIKFDRDGELVWILGDPAGWSERFRPYLLQPEGELEWPYHLHAPQVTPAGNLMVFDNGNFRAIPPAPPASAADSYSRAVEYEVDEEAMTVRQVWVYGGPGSEMFYAPFMGDADRLPRTGNVLIADGGRVVDVEGVPTNNVVVGRKWGRIIEVTDGDSPEIVFEIIFDAGVDAEGIAGWSIFTADRIGELQ